MLKGNCRKKNLTTCERKISSYKPAFTEVTENRVNDHYPRNIYIKVSLKIAVPWILLTSKLLYQNISKFVRKYRSRRPEVITVFTIKHAFPILVLV